MYRTAAFVFTTLLATTVAAQDRPNTILVMDGSGSMWGQIDGVAKITIAQDVVRDLLTDLPDSESLGLTVYGHRERGNCTDIENVVAPGPNTRDAIAAAVDEIQPLGKTPMTDAVIAAAEALRYTEDSATVILVSDGVETCNPDPCAAARLLEQAGIDFTAHVIGFDVSGDAEALAQMQCIADETGGMFIPASDASELSDALNTVVEEPEMIVVAGTFRAVIGENGPLIEEPILWDITSDSGQIVDDEFGNPLTTDLLEGSYTATAYRLIDEVAREVAFTVTGPGDVTVDVVFPEIIASATLDAPATAPVGSTIPVGWTGPGLDEDWIGIGAVDSNEPWKNFFYTRDGNPGDLLMPTEPGDYLIQYFQVVGRPSIASVPISLTPVTATIDAPAEATIGSDITASWTGPDYAEDYIGIGKVDATGGAQWQSYFYTKEGPNGTLTMPTEPGDYVIQYFFGQGQKPLMGVPITLTAVGAAITAPDTASVGETVTVGWDGPDYQQDFISVGLPGENQYENYAYTNEGNPLQLEMPTQPGTYEIRYQLRQGSEIIATRLIEVTALKPQIMAPDTAIAGSDVTVGWDGPDYPQDFIAVGIPGESGYINYTYTRDGNPLVLQMPTDAGDYEIRYTLRQDSEVIATKPITVTATTAQITAPTTATAGETLTIEWTGPDYDQDFLAIGKVGERGYVNYTYTRDGSPLQLQMPPEPGDYEIRYTLRQDSEVITATPITITPVTATLALPATAIAGETVIVEWTGPDYDQDFLAVGEVAERSYINYTYTREGSPLRLQMPPEPGTYEVRYILRQDSTVIASQTIEIAPTKARLAAPATIKLGEELIVGWDGPDYDQDFIGISEVGDPRGYETYTFTRDGNPLTLRMPDSPGDYEIRYFMRQDNTIIARVPLTITE